MLRSIKRKMLACILVLVLMLSNFPEAFTASATEVKSSVSYEFNKDGDAEGWMAYNNGVDKFTVEGGMLKLTLTGSDPYWYAPVPVNLQASEDQAIIIRFRATKGSEAAFYFDTDLSPGLNHLTKRIVFPITADGEFHEYTINPSVNPNWKGIINHFRMDLEPEGSIPSEVDIDYVRFVVKSDYSFEFFENTEGWSTVQGLSDLQAASGDITAVISGANPTIESGVIGKEAELLGEIKLRTKLAANTAKNLYISFTTDTSPEFSEENKMTIPVVADGTYHEYKAKLWEHPSWEGNIQKLRISLDSSDSAVGGQWDIDYLRFQSVKLPCYDWNTDGDAEQWTPLNDFTPFIIKDGLVKTTVTGDDPYLGISSLKGVIGERDKTIKIRMSATKGNFVSIFYATDSAPFYAEVRRIDFTITPDGQLHDYEIQVGDHPGWKGKITQLRLDLEGGDRRQAEFVLDKVQFVSAPASADIAVKRSVPDLHVGEEAVITADISNTGGKAFFNPKAVLIASEGLAIQDGVQSFSLEDIHPGDKRTVTWRVKALKESPSSVGISLDALGYKQSYTVALPVIKTYQAPSAVRPGKAQAYVNAETGDAVLENENTRIVAPKSAFGYGNYQVYSWDNSDGWKLMASVQPFATATVQQPNRIAETVSLHPLSATVEQTDGQSGLKFNGSTTDSIGRNWTFSFDFKLADKANKAVVEQNVCADRDADLLNMSGPVLTVGEGSFGSKKDEALFPGLEWLVNDEVSSSQLDDHTPSYLRYSPHPYKITVPLMAVRKDEHIVSLSWDPKQKWDNVHDLPAAQFASPNWVENQNNHVMGISALSVPTWVKENKTLAYNAYKLQANQSLKLQAGITTAKAESVSEAVNLYIQQEGLPERTQVNTFEKQVDLGLDAYTRTYWDQATKGWRHVNLESWGTYQFPADMVNLRLLAMSRPESKSKVEQVIADALNAMDDKKKLGEADGHIQQMQAPFYVGYMEEALAGMEEAIKSIINEQDASGAWLYKKQDQFNPPLGENGTPLFGATASNVKQLLMYSEMSGDKQAKEAGLRGLAAMEKMGDVPRAGQSWEVPLHTPDILAAGNAVGAYVQAYKITGNKYYMDKAVKWAKAGMPFVYTWGVEERPVMEYGTIPIFGASAYINPWFASLVQWNGLEYAYEILNLSVYDASGPWKQLAEGILLSAERQQASGDDEVWRGGYPDNWRLISNSRSDTVMLNPEEIVKSIYQMRYVEGKGPNPDINTVVIKGSPASGEDLQGCPDARVTSLAKITKTLPSNTQHLVSFTLEYPSGETTYSLVIGREKPRMITVDGENLAEQSDLNTAESGWKYIDDKQCLLLKLKHTGKNKVMIHY